MDRLETHLARLVEQQVISASQAQELMEAARADELDNQRAPIESAPRSSLKSSSLGGSATKPEEFGSLGGSWLRRRRSRAGCGDHARLLVLGRPGSTGRKLVAVASLIVPALGGAALIKGSPTGSVGSCLHRLLRRWLRLPGCLRRSQVRVSAAVVVLTSAIGAVLLRSGAFLSRAGPAPCCWCALSSSM